MSDKCDGCSCTDKSQCTKKGNSLIIVETERSYIDTVVVDAPAAEHNNGKCRCGDSCACVNCTCGD
ncbi:hypothetical protein FNV43_RR16807 [Rhamnella rubrinervis]|uniref:Metallothionein n=1 Tax=Rhamnella rubrinervis TaxID=2594499 RepID=A0A8K0GZG5_9ROSA|nr:hypothetical protein FNV43_RR16807 [Rhamnella rubrinervis]